MVPTNPIRRQFTDDLAFAVFASDVASLTVLTASLVGPEPGPLEMRSYAASSRRRYDLPTFDPLGRQGGTISRWAAPSRTVNPVTDWVPRRAVLPQEAGSQTLSGKAMPLSSTTATTNRQPPS
jgi:hypothetical protein